MNIERFHNELAMRLGYERIVKDKRIHISVKESDEPWMTLRVDGDEDIRFKVSESSKEINCPKAPDIKEIVDAAHQAYMATVDSKF